MELIIIDERKLKIMLTPPDMRYYDLCAERMTAANAATRRAFRHIFDDARDRIGFDTTGERLLVQLYTSRGGGCEIFVTKLGAEDEFEPNGIEDGEGSAHSATRNHEDALLARLAKEDTMITVPSAEHRPTSTLPIPETSAYRFFDAEELFALCRRLAAAEYEGGSTVYIADHVTGESVWYLFLTPSVGRSLPPFVREYASPVEEPETLSLYLAEYGRCICEAVAVERLGLV